MVSYVAERDLKIIYFDGLSASLGTRGWQDSQDVLVYGRVRNESERFPWGRSKPKDGKDGSVMEEKQEGGDDDEGTTDPRGPWFDPFGEYAMAKSLCDLGKEWGFEGVVRTNAGFELLWCDFTNGIRLLSQTNVTDPSLLSQPFNFPFPPRHDEPQTVPPADGDSDSSPKHPERPKRPNRPERYGPYGPRWPLKRSAFSSLAHLQWARSSSWHLLAPGEHRVQLALPYAVTFYDPMFPSLSKSRIGKERWQFTLAALTPEEGKEVSKLLQENLKSWNTGGRRRDAVDWRAITQTVVQRFEGGLKGVEYALRNKAVDEAVAIAYHLVMAFIDTSGWPTVAQIHPNDTHWSGNTEKGNEWVEDALRLCTRVYTDFGESWEGERTERLVKDAVEGALGQICQNCIGIVREGYQFLNVDSKSGQGLESIDKRKSIFFSTWIEQVANLRSWLGWIDYDGCKGGCEPNQFCAVPLWPITFRPPEEEEERRPSLKAECMGDARKHELRP
ncbi:hypothetical protein BT69DRAFT_1286423 [Atractiella rhizophila]|nr:hypothetical protein BT69DRAFT_1286423 [Atractiella rhizophila]